MNKQNEIPNINKKAYWFVNKKYGWGLSPATWQGWLITGAYLLCVFYLSFTIKEPLTGADLWDNFFSPFVLLTIGFIAIAFYTGEKIKWHWPKNKK